MMPVIWLLIVQGALGAFDTLWYHEWKVARPVSTNRVAVLGELDRAQGLQPLRKTSRCP